MQNKELADAYRRNVVFLFGAGASFGCGDILPEQPPLGFQLYSALSKVYPRTWGALRADIRAGFADNFEVGMGMIYERFSTDIAPLMQEMALYLVQFRPVSNSSMYCRLVQAMADLRLMHHVLFSTLNYDCILEFSLLNHGHVVSYFGAEDAEAVLVWKLHGSCNMFSKDILAGRGIVYGGGVVFEGGLEAPPDIGSTVGRLLGDTGLAPAMCLYMRGKPLQISPSVILDLQRRWQDAVLHAALVITIGVNPWPEDTHVWGALGETPAQLLFIGDGPRFTDWSKDNRIGPSEYLGNRFHLAFPALIRRLAEHEAIASG